MAEDGLPSLKQKTIDEEVGVHGMRKKDETKTGMAG